MWWWLPGPSRRLLLLWQAEFWPKCFTSLPMGFYFMLGEQLEPPLAAHPLSASGSFSRRTLHPLLICLPIPAHMVEIWAISSVCRLGDRDPWSLLYWCGAQLRRQQRHQPVGLNAEGHASGLSRSFIPPPFSLNEQLEETFPVESEGSGYVGIHPGTHQCPHDAPSLRSTNPLHLPTPWWQGFYLSYPHNATLADCNN